MLVCKDCRKRGNGPQGLKPKAVARRARAELRGVRPRPRVVLTSCLGLCPKAALAIARVGGDAAAQLAAIDSLARVAEAVPLLVAGSRA